MWAITCRALNLVSISSADMETCLSFSKAFLMPSEGHHLLQRLQPAHEVAALLIVNLHLVKGAVEGPEGFEDLHDEGVSELKEATGVSGGRPSGSPELLSLHWTQVRGQGGSCASPVQIKLTTLGGPNATGNVCV